MKIHKIIVGPLENNCYFLENEKNKEAIIIDPGAEAEKILDFIKNKKLKPAAIILTHGHPDHIGAVEKLKNYFNINLFQGPSLGNLDVIEMPGHTPDGVCIVSRGDKAIFTGDTLFKNSIGRTDLAGGDEKKIFESLARLLRFPDDFKVYPGHGPESTIGEERQNNPFLVK